MDRTKPVRVLLSSEVGDIASSGETEIAEIDRVEWDAVAPAQRAARCNDMADEAAFDRFS